MDFSKVGAYLDSLIEDGQPMAQVVVTKDYETVYIHNAGWADYEKTVPLNDRHLSMIQSNTKVYTAVCAMRLVEEGKLGPDDPVAKYLPAFARLRVWKDGKTVPAENTLRIRHLLTMTSGYALDRSLYPHYLEAVKNPAVTTFEAASAFAEEPLLFEPGTDFKYGVSLDILGAVIEVASGERFGDYMKTVILDPLGIEDTGFHPTEEQRARLMAQYKYNPETGAFDRFATPKDRTPNFDRGGGGLCSSSVEYCKLLTALACGGVSRDGYRVLKPETIRLMTENRLTGRAWTSYHTRGGEKIRAGYGYGFGVRTHVDPAASGRRSSVGEFGWTGMAGAFSSVDPGRRLAICYGEHIRNHVKRPGDPKSHHASKEIYPTLVNLICEAIDKG